ncbi:uncharacterized protein DDB_G0290685-like [Lethenteron reissneri]|uniref:uncharacterized protein DDB_G0290685-like n=1 Tax=Lethenteron reissneri TaxID=7753 RepID=UPI002AB7279A|nr:uncharacterized protein DDB_G0290685-like [Lethenteron reissneri]
MRSRSGLRPCLCGLLAPAHLIGNLCTTACESVHEISGELQRTYVRIESCDLVPRCCSDGGGGGCSALLPRIRYGASVAVGDSAEHSVGTSKEPSVSEIHGPSDGSRATPTEWAYVEIREASPDRSEWAGARGGDAARGSGSGGDVGRGAALTSEGGEVKPAAEVATSRGGDMGIVASSTDDESIVYHDTLTPEEAQLAAGRYSEEDAPDGTADWRDGGERVPDETTDQRDGGEHVPDETTDQRDGGEHVPDEIVDRRDNGERLPDESANRRDNGEQVTDETTCRMR